MQGPTYIFFLQDDATGTFYRHENGAVLLGPPRPLQFSPSGWQNLAITNQRNSTYFALDRAFAVAPDFVEDGAAILKDVFYKQGMEKNINLIIARQELYIDATDYGFYYKPFYKGEVDFSTFTHDGPKVSVSIMEGGIVKLIKANQATKYEIELDVPQAVELQMDGIKLRQALNYKNITFDFQGTNDLASHYLPVIVQGVDGTNVNIATSSQSFGPFSGTPQWFADATEDPITIQLNGSIKFRTNNRVAIINLFLDKFDISNARTNIAFQLFNPSPTTDTTWQFNLSIPLVKGDRLLLRAAAIPTGGPGNADQMHIYYTETDISISADTKYHTTFTKAFYPLYVFQKLIEKISDGTVTGYSNLLTANYNFLITCGDAIRRLPGSKIKTSLADFFQSMNTQFDIGLGMVGGQLRLEEKAFFVDYSNPIFLGEVSGLKVKKATDYVFNTVKVGYPPQDYDAALGAVNGRLEFNNTYQYTAPITRLTKELDLVSIYRADAYGIEFTRINLDGKTTTDDSSDNDVFIIHATGHYVAPPGVPAGMILNRDLNPYISGVIDAPSVFNVYLSPGRCLRRNGRFIHSCFYKAENGIIKFQTTDKNSQLVTTPPSGPVEIDIADADINTMLAPLFRNIILEFDTPAPVDLFEILDQNPVKAFEFTYYGITYRGIPIKASTEPYTEDKQTYTLLSAPDNDLTTLIDVYE